MTTSHYDVVVVGAGLAGLGAAVTLADAGRRVLVLEHAHQPGGYAVVFERPPFRFDASLHELDGFAPGGRNDRLLQRLGIADQVELTRLDPLYQVQTAEGPITVPADFDDYQQMLVERFPHERDGIGGWFDDVRSLHADTDRFTADRRAGRTPEPTAWASAYPTLVRLAGQTFKQATEALVSDPTLAGVLTILWTYAATPSSRLSATMGMGMVSSYGQYGGWYPRGGAAAIPRALAGRLDENGTPIRYGQTVTRLEVDNGRVAWVHTATGEPIECDWVVSTAAAPLLPGLLGEGVLPEDYRARVTESPVATSSISVYLGLDRDVFAEHRLPHEVFIGGVVDVDADPAALATDDEIAGGLLATDYTHVDPGCAPGGGAVVVLTAAAPYGYGDSWGTERGSPGEVKSRVADAIVDAADRAIPGLRSAIVTRDVATPVTNQRYTLNPQGSWAGYETRPEMSGPGALGSATPVPNLLLAGAWTGAFGQSSALAAGLAAARRLLKTART